MAHRHQLLFDAVRLAGFGAVHLPGPVQQLLLLLLLVDSLQAMPQAQLLLHLPQAVTGQQAGYASLQVALDLPACDQLYRAAGHWWRHCCWGVAALLRGDSTQGLGTGQLRSVVPCYLVPGLQEQTQRSQAQVKPAEVKAKYRIP